MACNTCAKPFNLFRKEKGCPGCGFSFCSKCLEHNIFVQKLSCEAKVCISCKNASNKVTVAPPDAYFKRVELTENKVIEQRLVKLKQTEQPSTSTDHQIAARLKNLKEDVPTVSDAEIKERLARLRGVPVTTLETKIQLPIADTRTEQQQADDLLKQYLEQTKVDSKYNNEFNEVINDMEQRLQKLKGPKTSQNAAETKTSEESPTDEEMVKKIIEKYRAEVIVDDTEIEEKIAEENEELPFCEICNEDATLRCLGCRYLFCKRCYLEHKDDDDDCNRYETYKPHNIK